MQNLPVSFDDQLYEMINCERERIKKSLSVRDISMNGIVNLAVLVYFDKTPAERVRLMDAFMQSRRAKEGYSPLEEIMKDVH
jgi:hypothetical protein